MHQQNCVVTLTYAPGEEPLSFSKPLLDKYGKAIPGERVEQKSFHTLDHRDVTLFIKKLRKNTKKDRTYVNRETGEQVVTPLRYFAAGEYGDTMVYGSENLGRPHYHVLLFGYRPKDLEHYATAKDGSNIYTSESLAETWGKGNAPVGEVSYASAAYAAGYCMKKRYGNQSDEYYRRYDENGEIHPVCPEYSQMSRRPGLGVPWLKKYWRDVTKGYMYHEGKKVPTPAFYERWILENKHDIRALEKTQEARKFSEKAAPEHPDNAPERMATKARALEIKLNRKRKQL